MGTPTWRVVVVGAVMGLLAVGAFVALVVSGVLPGAPPKAASVDGPVLVMLVQPDASGVNVPRVIDLYTRIGAVTAAKSIEPSQSATVPGTTAQTLADAYTFGGGSGVTTAFTHAVGGASPAWVVVDPDAWAALFPSGTLHLDVPADMQVFDGSALYTFQAGPADIPIREMPQLLDGAGYLSPDQQVALRAAVGDRLGSALASATPAQAALLKSAFSAEELAKWLSAIGSVHRPNGS